MNRETESLKAQVNLKESKIERLQSIAEVTEQQNKLREIEGELLEIKNNAKSSVVDDVAAQRKVVSDAEQRVYELTSKIKNTNRSIESNNEMLQMLRDKIQRLGEEYQNANAEEFTHEVDGTCHACVKDLLPTKLKLPIKKRSKSSTKLNPTVWKSSKTAVSRRKVNSKTRGSERVLVQACACGCIGSHTNLVIQTMSSSC